MKGVSLYRTYSLNKFLFAQRPYNYQGELKTTESPFFKC